MYYSCHEHRADCVLRQWKDCYLKSGYILITQCQNLIGPTRMQMLLKNLQIYITAMIEGYYSLHSTVKTFTERRFLLQQYYCPDHQNLNSPYNYALPTLQWNRQCVCVFDYGTNIKKTTDD